jgi:hypothetical protein
VNRRAARLFARSLAACSLAACSLAACSPRASPPRSDAVGLPPPALTVDVPSASAFPPSLPATVTVSCSQPGVRVAFDDGEAAPTPRSMEVDPGIHEARFAGERYEHAEARFTITSGQRFDLTCPRLRVVRAKVTLLLSTANASVHLVSGAERREITVFPIAIEFDPIKPWTLTAHKPGFRSFRQELRFDDGVAERTIVIELSK